MLTDQQTRQRKERQTMATLIIELASTLAWPTAIVVGALLLRPRKPRKP